MGYRGKERRRRFVYTTRNTDYHIYDSICVAVRDRSTGSWLEGHAAVSRRLEGGVRVFSNGAVLPSLKPPELGDPIYFVLDCADEDEQLVTSRLQQVGRPAGDELPRYPLQN